MISRGASIVWAAALIAVGLAPTAVMADEGHAAAVPALRGATDVQGIGASTKGGAPSKADPALYALHGEYQTYLQTSDAHTRGPSGFTSRNPLARIAEGHVVIDTAAENDPKALASDLETLGLEDAAVFGRMVSGRLSLTAVPSLEDLASLRFARPAYAMTLVGSVTSQGDAAMRADIARNAFAVDGTGVTVGVLSDSFDCLGGAAAGVASGDLPAGIVVLEEIGDCTGATDEARALAEVIHDVAPGAAIAVHSAFNGQANFAQGIIDLANAGAKVIVDDVIYFTEPMFQDGIVAQAVDQVKARGISYFSAAGDEGRRSYESPFRPSGIFFAGQEAHDFDPGPGVDVCQEITVPGGGPVLALDFQWDQPFFSVSGPPGSQSDMDIVFTNAACAPLFRTFTHNVGGDPFEGLAFGPFPVTVTLGVMILRFSGPNPGLMKTVLFGTGQHHPELRPLRGPRRQTRRNTPTINEFDTRSGASFGHNAARGGLGVGAADYRDTPAFGRTPPLIEDFSSVGGIPILFDTAGNRLATPEVRQQPDITAPDGADTTFFPRGPGSDTDGTGFPNFFGTSAAAAHAAGVAALLKDLNPAASPDEIYNVLKAAAIDMDDPATPGFDMGFDFGSGFGLIRGDVTFGPPPPPPPFEAEPARPRFSCRSAARCRVPVSCNLAQIAGNCGNPIEVLVPSRALRTSGEVLAKGPRQIRFGASVTNVPPGTIGNVPLTLPKRIRNFIRKTEKKTIRAQMQIRSAAGTAIETRRIRIRLK